MKHYAVHIAAGLGIAILLGGCGLLLNVAPAGGTPLNQPSSYVPPTIVPQPTPTEEPSFTAPPGLRMPEPDEYAFFFEDGSYIGLSGESGCIEWWPCDFKAEAAGSLTIDASNCSIFQRRLDSTQHLRQMDVDDIAYIEEWPRSYTAIRVPKQFFLDRIKLYDRSIAQIKDAMTRSGC